MGDGRTGEEIREYLFKSIDTTTENLATITTDHRYIHEGRLFCYPLKVALNGGASYKVTILTPDVASGLIMHYRPAYISTSGDNVTITTYEGSSGNSGGSAVTPINRNRGSTRTSQSTVNIGQTVTTNGTMIDMQYVGGGTGVGSTSSGEISSAEDELYLNPATLYTIVIDNGSSDSNTIFLLLHWYEEDV